MALDFFVYPRLDPRSGAVLGYDYGYIMGGRYRVTGTAADRDVAETLIAVKYAGAGSVTHEQDPSASKDGYPYPTSATRSVRVAQRPGR